MLLQRVNLKGFLAHRGVQNNENGAFDGSIELDFRGSSLWLIHGPNGSGKSSIFDAVTFALYDQARGRGSGFGDFINDRCDRAEIEVEIEVGGQSYQINRGVSRGRAGKGAGQNSGLVHRRVASELQIEPGTTNAVPAWAESTLRLSYENFVCAAILRQGEADAFLKARPAKRKEQLMKLLDLDVYKRLGEVANARKTHTQALLRARQTELDACRLVSDEEVERARERVESAKEALQLANEAFEAQATLWRDAGQNSQWLGEIAAKEKQQQKDAPILEEAARLEADAQRHADLGSGLPLLTALWRLRETLETENKTLTTARENLAKVKADLESLAPKLHSAIEAETHAQGAVAAAQSQKIAVERDKATLDGDLAQLKRIEGLERQIEAAETAIAPFRAILEAAATIERDFARFQDLKTAGQKLSPLHKAEKKRAQAELDLVKAQNAHQKARETLAKVKDRPQQCEDALPQLEADIEDARLQIEERNRRLHTLQEKLGYRAEVENADDCPTCGSHLDDPQTRARLGREREIWSREAEALTEESRLWSEKQRALQSDKTRAVAALKEAQKAWREADNQKTLAHKDELNAQGRLDETTRERDEARIEAGEFAARIGDFEAICDEYTRLQREEIEARHGELLNARHQTLEAQTTTGIYRRQLRDDLPQWSNAERALLREREIEIESNLSGAKDAEKSAQDVADGATQTRQTLEGEGEKLSRAQEKWSGQCDDGADRVETAQQKVEAEFASLPAPWNEHAAAHDAAELERLRRELAGLTNGPQRLENLRDAQGRVNALHAQIETLRGNIEKLPAAHRIAPEMALAQKNKAEIEQKERLSARDAAIQQLASDERDRENYQSCRSARDGAEQIASRADKLARAFGPGGLQAKIVSEAQRTISELANETLAKLSQGNWQIDLRENSAGTELEIIARDLGRGGRERPFECLSGGERFRVAISLAIAIGGSACGGQAINTLVIDEGFGALDDINRGLLVDELRRLSEQVLRGGRIIIVSHQDDVCSEFDFRFQLSRDADGYAQVTRFTP